MEDARKKQEASKQSKSEPEDDRTEDEVKRPPTYPSPPRVPVAGTYRRNYRTRYHSPGFFFSPSKMDPCDDCPRVVDTPRLIHGHGGGARRYYSTAPTYLHFPRRGAGGAGRQLDSTRGGMKQAKRHLV